MSCDEFQNLGFNDDKRNWDIYYEKSKNKKKIKKLESFLVY